MIPVPTGVRIWVATGATDKRKGMQGLVYSCRKALVVIRSPEMSSCSADAAVRGFLLTSLRKRTAAD